MLTRHQAFAFCASLIICLFLCCAADDNTKIYVDPIQVFMGCDSPEGNVTASANSLVLTFSIMNTYQEASNNANDVALFSINFLHNLSGQTLNARLFMVSDNVTPISGSSTSGTTIAVQTTMDEVSSGTISDATSTLDIFPGTSQILNLEPRKTFQFALWVDTTNIGGQSITFSVESLLVQQIGSAQSLTIRGDDAVSDALVSGNQINVTTASSTAPSLTSWDLNLTASQITLNFDATVDASSLTVAGITLQDAATATTSYTLTSGSTASNDGTTIVIDLSATDKDAITNNAGLATSSTNSFLTMTSSTISDTSGNNVNAIADGSGVQVSNYTN